MNIRRLKELFARDNASEGKPPYINGRLVNPVASCHRKIPYATVAEAVAAKHGLGRKGKKMTIYRCHFAAHWHLAGGGVHGERTARFR